MTSEKEKLAAGTAELLELNSKENRNETFYIPSLKEPFIIMPGVFSPKYFPETTFFAENLRVERDDLFWEVGCGTGIASVLASRKGAQLVLATDINPQARINALENLYHHVNSKKEYRTGIADLFNFENDYYTEKDSLIHFLTRRAKFNKIFWNIPWDSSPKDKASTMLERACYDPNHETFKRFMNGVQDHLHHNGSLLLGVSPTICDMDIINKTIRNAGFVYKVIAESKVELGKSQGVRVEKYKGSTETLDLQLLEAN